MEFLHFTSLSQSPNIFVCLFIRSVTHITLDMSLTDYSLQHNL